MLDKKISSWNIWDLHFHTSNGNVDNDVHISDNDIIKRAKDIVNALKKENVSLMVMTDHMMFNRPLYDEFQKVNSPDLTILPGMEFNVNIPGSLDYIQILIAVDPTQVEDFTTEATNLSISLSYENRSISLEEFAKLVYKFRHVCYWEFGKSRGFDKKIRSKSGKNTIEKLFNVEFIYSLNLTDSPNDLEKIKERILKFIGKSNSMKTLNKTIIFTASDNHDISAYPFKTENGITRKWNKTWFKGINSFKGLQYVFTESSRVQINGDNDPEFENNINYIKSIKIFNGEKQEEIFLSKYLNSIVGSRSSGKSILLKLIALNSGFNFNDKSEINFLKKFKVDLSFCNNKVNCEYFGQNEFISKGTDSDKELIKIVTDKGNFISRSNKIEKNWDEANLIISSFLQYKKYLADINKYLLKKELLDIKIYKDQNKDNFSDNIAQLSNINRLLNIDSRYNKEIIFLKNLIKEQNDLKIMAKNYSAVLEIKRELNKKPITSSEIVNATFAGKETQVINIFNTIFELYKKIKYLKLSDKIKAAKEIVSFSEEQTERYSISSNTIDIKNIRTSYLSENLFEAIMIRITKNRQKDINILSKIEDILKLNELESLFKRDIDTISIEKLDPILKEHNEISINGRKFDIDSPGKRAATLLDIFLTNNNTIPLLIDQPEDNLDNKYISEQLAVKIKSLKKNSSNNLCLS